MRQRQQRTETLARIAVVGPRIDMRWRDDDGRVAVVLKPINELERGFLQPRERELVVVIFVPVVPRGNSSAAAAHTFRQHNHAPAVEIGDIRWPTRTPRIRWIALKRHAIGDTNEIGAERTRFRFDLRRSEGLGERRDHYSPASTSAGAASFFACWAFLNSCNCRATIPL